MDYSSFIATNPGFAGVTGLLLGVLVIWTLVWKGLALWRAARRNENAWFIALLILNTAGILEIIYYFLIAKTDKKR
ncbi:MAG: DUF5652 family protein [Candidatus Berkelbacteria bacterium]